MYRLYYTLCNDCCQQCSISVPATWVKFTQDNLARAQKERENSVKLRGDMDALMRACANDMWTQYNSVNNALNSRVNETKDAKNKMQAHLQKVKRYVYYPTLRARRYRRRLYLSVRTTAIERQERIQELS